MRRNLFALLASLAVAGSLAAAQVPTPGQGPQQPASPQPRQEPAPQPRSQAQSAEETLTGCLVQGSGPNVFILENAKANANDRSMGKSYVLSAAAGTAVDFRSQLNRQVRIVGAADEKTSAGPSSTPSPSAGQSGQASQPGQSAQAGQSGQAGQASRMADEKNLPKLSAKSITRVADTCATS